VRTLANTTILSNFAAVNRLDLIKRLHGRLYVTNEVYEEILDGLDEGYDFYAAIDVQIYPFAKDGWIELVSMVAEDEFRLFRSLPRRLHRGEASCLAIARHRAWALLTDDKLARETAHAWEITVSGTLGVLVQAVKRRLLTAEEGNTLLKQMIARGYRSPYSSLQHLLEQD
jgi:predicted nucleic acid-binding protein